MTIKTRHFGEITIDDNKVITMEEGMFGFEQYKKYVLLYDSSSETVPDIKWLQSVDEEALAFPVMNPTVLLPGYAPDIAEASINKLGECGEDGLTLLSTVTIPTEIKNMSINLKAPIIINVATMKACQAVAENPEYEVRFKFYALLEAAKKNMEEKES